MRLAAWHANPAAPAPAATQTWLWLIPALLLVGALVALLAWSPMRNQLLALLPGRGTAALGSNA